MGQSKSASVRLHRGDIMSPATRSALMARIRGKGTRPELLVAELLKSVGIVFDEHARDLPGRPDFVLRDFRVAVFVDGDFWHGWRFPKWRLKLSEKWEVKIEGNRLRDARNFVRCGVADGVSCGSGSIRLSEIRPSASQECWWPVGKDL